MTTILPIGHNTVNITNYTRQGYLGVENLTNNHIIIIPLKLSDNSGFDIDQENRTNKIKE